MKDSPEPLGPLWDVVLPLVYGRRETRGFDIAGVAGTCFIPHPGVVVSCAHCFGGLNEWEYAVTKVPVHGAAAPVAIIRDITSHADGFDLAVGTVADARFRPLPPFTIEEARIGMAILAPGYPLPGRHRRSLDEPAVIEATVRGMRGHVTSDGVVTGLSRYGALPSIELDLHAPGGLSGAPVFDWGLVQNPLKLVGVVRGSNIVATSTMSHSHQMTRLRTSSGSHSGWHRPPSHSIAFGDHRLEAFNWASSLPPGGRTS